MMGLMFVLRPAVSSSDRSLLAGTEPAQEIACLMIKWKGTHKMHASSTLQALSEA